MNLEERIESFALLGEFLRNSLNGSQTTNAGNGLDYSLLDTLVDNQHKMNPWFTSENVRRAIASIAEELTEENLTKWTNSYPQLSKKTNPSRIGVIMAGNIPLVGFHEFLSVLITGNRIIAKTSSKDSNLITFIGNTLCSINPAFRDKLEFTEGILTGFDAVIATGSNNSSRYFEYYFGKYPNIIRKNRNSVAILDGNETDTELWNLGKDIFLYFGLGCRNVSKIYVPRGYVLSSLERNWNDYDGLISNIKYANNYDFNKAVYLVN